MNFTDALKSIKDGNLAYREAWKGQKAVWLKPSCVVKSEWCKDPSLKKIADLNGGEIYAQAVICVYITDDHNNESIITGWNPAPEDMLADDWEIICNEES